MGEFGCSRYSCILPDGMFEGWGLSNADMQALIDRVIDVGAAPVDRKMLLGRVEDPKVLRVWEGVCVRLDRHVALNPGTVPAHQEFCIVRAPWGCDMIN
jgi:hypothetical protein